MCLYTLNIITLYLKMSKSYFTDDFNKIKILGQPNISYNFPRPSIHIKLLIIGTNHVGKTTMLHQYTHKQFCPNMASTIGVDFVAVYIKKDEQQISMQIWDTAGQERFRAMTQAVYHGTHGIIVVFDITDQKTFNDVKIWVNDAYRICEKNTPVILIGNKTDLEHVRVVSKNEGEQLAKEMNGIYIETSAVSGYNIDNAFMMAMNAGINKYNARINEEVALGNSNRKTLTFKQHSWHNNLTYPPGFNSSEFEKELKSNEPQKENKCCT
jgi:small GTP-binding protein